jgi:LysM repeat protein
MLKKIFYLLIIAVSGFAGVNAQKLTPEQYVEKYKDLAIREMKRMGVPAAITLAQGLLETENGNSDLVKKSNNHFGIKCKSSWTAEGVTHDDDAPGECFRSYKDAEASYRDHSNYLRGTDRYAFLFALDPADYKGWARGLRKAGYATNPKYPDILIKNIEQYNLQQYSLQAANEVPKVETGKYEDDKEPPVKKNQNNSEQSSTNNNEQNISVTSGTNLINGHKYMYGKKGTSLLAIATENDINLNKLLACNDLEEDGILKNDQIIFLQKKSKTGSTDYYIVQPDESLYDVAQKNGMQLKYLLAYNQLTDNATIPGGTKLYLNPSAQNQQAMVIKEAASTKVSEAPAAPAAVTNKIHEVQPREGLYAIARKYQVTVQQLREWNHLSSDELKIGQQIIVSNKLK